MFDLLIHGFSVALQPYNLIIATAGCVIGTLVGVLPGLGPGATIAMLLPMVFSMGPTSAMIMFCGVYYGAMYGGSTTSILVNIPGESASVITTIDGHEMALQGRAGPALAIAAIGSFIAGTFAVAILSVAGPPIASYALEFGPTELFSLLFFGLCTVAGLSSKSIVKAAANTCFGLMIATVGIDLISGIPRYTFGNPSLHDGIEFLVVAIGVFAFSEVIITARDLRGGLRAQTIKAERLWVNIKEIIYCLPSILRGTIIGFCVGTLPGSGTTLPTFIAYNLEKRTCKNPELFGTGDIRGVANPEASNNAASGGSVLPMLTLGIPGGAATAIMMGALMMLGITPGPLLFEKHADLVWALIASMYVSNGILLVLNWPLVNLFARMLSVPARILMPIVVVVATIGVWSLGCSPMDLILTGVCGLLGYYMRKHDFPIVPLVLGLILGRRMEQSFRKALIISRGSPWVFFKKPLSVAFLICSVIFILLPTIIERWKRLRAAISAPR